MANHPKRNGRNIDIKTSKWHVFGPLGRLAKSAEADAGDPKITVTRLADGASWTHHGDAAVAYVRAIQILSHRDWPGSEMISVANACYDEPAFWRDNRATLHSHELEIVDRVVANSTRRGA